MYTYFSRGGQYRVTALNADGRTVIKLYDAGPKAGGAAEAARGRHHLGEHLAERQPHGLLPERRPLAEQPLRARVRHGEARRLTDTLNTEIDPDDLVEAEVVRFKSFDGMVVPTILYKPHQATARPRRRPWSACTAAPAARPAGYSALIQYLVNHGYVVLGINNRGSSGYGKTFFTADDQKHGREPLWDCVEGKKYLASLPYVDPDRIGIIGGSYGGYMVLAALAFQPEEFDVGVDIFGVANWVRTLESIPPWWESQRRGALHGDRRSR